MTKRNAVPDRRIKLRHLEAFLSIADTGSLSVTAGRLSLTQPAVSKTLKEFETILGVRLIDRDRSGARLTRHGRAFLPAATASMQQLQFGLTSLAQMDRSQRMRLTLGVLPTAAGTILPRAVAAFQDRYPESAFRVITGPSDFLLDQLRSGAVDLVIGRMADPDRLHGLSFQVLYAEAVVFLARAGHPLTRKADFAPSDIVAYPLILPDRGAIIRRPVDQLFQALQIPVPAATIETVAHAFSRTYAMDTDAVWVISEGVAARDIAEGTLVKLPVSSDIATGAAGYTLRAGDPGSPALRLFIDTLVEVAG